MRFHFLYTVGTINKFFTTYACFCFYVMEFRKQKNILRKRGFVFYSKKKKILFNEIKPVWFYSLYRNYFFE